MTLTYFKEKNDLGPGTCSCFTNTSCLFWILLIVLEFVDHFVSSPRAREKRDRRDSRGDEREGKERKRKMIESEETEETKTSPSALICCKDSRPYPPVSQYQLDAR